MGVAAVPEYLLLDPPSQDLMSPGHRFGLYFPAWNKTTWKIEDRAKALALEKILPLSKGVLELLCAVRQRQEQIISMAGDSYFTIEAVSTAPFMTGMGLEHPLENGFSFLNPYGLPYLPGSGVKGVLRNAAEQLAVGNWEDRKGWDFPSIWLLFGFEPESTYFTGPSEKIPDELLREEAITMRESYLRAVKEKQYDKDALIFFIDNALSSEIRAKYRKSPEKFLKELASDKSEVSKKGGGPLRKEISYQGSLSFLDVFPEPAGNKLSMDILTPHYTGYYQDSKAPSDCEQPNPVPFLTIPPQSAFRFYVLCRKGVLSDSLKQTWQRLLEAAFEHAYEWMGFGAKSAVGYGQLKKKYREEPKPTPLTKEPDTRETWEKAYLSWSPGNQTLKATWQEKNKKATLVGKEAAIQLVPASFHKKLLEKKKAVAARVTVEPVGNAFLIVKIEEIS